MEAYKERFIKEYTELATRWGKLKVMLQKWDNGELDFEPDCPKELLTEQAEVMEHYMQVLEERAEKYENIPLPQEVRFRYGDSNA